MKPNDSKLFPPFLSKVVSTEGDLNDRARLWTSGRGNYITISTVYKHGMIVVSHDRGRQFLPKNWELV